MYLRLWFFLFVLRPSFFFFFFSADALFDLCSSYYPFSLQLQTAEQAVLEKKGTATAARGELEAVKLRVETLSAQLQQYQDDVSTGCICLTWQI